MDKKHITLTRGKFTARIYAGGYVEYVGTKGVSKHEWIGKTKEEAVTELVAKGWKVVTEAEAPPIPIKKPKSGDHVKTKPMKFVKNIPLENNRVLRMEIIGGDVSEAEEQFLLGSAHFIGGTISQENPEHVAYVSEMMKKLITHLVKKIKEDDEKARGEKDIFEEDND